MSDKCRIPHNEDRTDGVRNRRGVFPIPELVAFIEEAIKRYRLYGHTAAERILSLFRIVREASHITTIGIIRFNTNGIRFRLVLGIKFLVACRIARNIRLHGTAKIRCPVPADKLHLL